MVVNVNVHYSYVYMSLLSSAERSKASQYDAKKTLQADLKMLPRDLYHDTCLAAPLRSALKRFNMTFTPTPPKSVGVNVRPRPVPGLVCVVQTLNVSGLLILCPRESLFF